MNKEQMWTKYFVVFKTINNLSITKAEIRLLAYCLMEDKLSMETFSGTGRKKLLESLSLHTTTLSALLKSLVAKGLMVKRDHGSYDLTDLLKKMKQVVDTTGGIDVKYRLEWK